MSIPHTFDHKGLHRCIASGDFDGDGTPDLVALRESPTKASTGLTIEYSSGLRESPTKQSTGKTLARGPVAYEDGIGYVFVWDTACDVCVADMDGDGCPDLVVAGGSSRQVGIWRCNPDFRHEFLPPVVVDSKGSVDRVAVGDVNGDGQLDLVTLDESTGVPTEMLWLDLLVYQPSEIPSVGACHGLVLCDLDRDGTLDIVTNDPAGDRILCLFGGGASGFTLRESPTRASTGRAMAVGDVDGDGWLDVVVVDEGGRSVTCLHQRPAEPGVFDDVHSPLAVALDEDGIECTQLAIGDPGVNGNLVKSPRDSSSGLSTGRRLHSVRSTCFVQPGIGLADLDRDGTLDLVGAPLETFPIPDGTLVLSFGSTLTRGGFGPSQQRAKGIVKGIPTTTPRPALCIDDLDQDGHLDLASTNPESATLTLEYFEDGDIPTSDDFSERLRIVPTAQTTGCATADLDRDGLVDCVTATTTGLEVRFQNTASPGEFLPPLVLAPAQDCRAVAVGDVNGDGCPDLVVCAGANGATFPRDPLKPRSFLAPVPFPAPPQGTLYRSIALGDLDADGYLDLFVIRESPSKGYYGRNNKSPSFFDVFTEISLGIVAPMAVEIADLDGDGDLDLAVAGVGLDGSCVVRQDGHVTVLKMAEPTPLYLQRGVRVATGDVNGDGRVDVVTSGDEGVCVALQSADERGRFLPAYALSTEACGGLSVGDLDRDGRLDVCFVELALGTLACVTGDPDFDLLRIISLNGLPPGIPVEAMLLVGTNSIGDPDFDLLVVCPDGGGSTTGTIRMFSNEL